MSHPPGFDPRTVEAVASRYTDCAIPPPPPPFPMCHHFMDWDTFTFPCYSGMEADCFSRVQRSRIRTSCHGLKMETFPVSEIFFLNTMNKVPNFGQFMTTYHRNFSLLLRNILLNYVTSFSYLVRFQTSSVLF